MKNFNNLKVSLVFIIGVIAPFNIVHADDIPLCRPEIVITTRGDNITASKYTSNFEEYSIRQMKLMCMQEKQEKVEKARSELEKLQQAQAHQLYLNKISSLIQDYSDIDSNTAYKYAALIDKVTTEFKQKYNFDKNVSKLLALIFVESDFNYKAVSNAGAKGLMQLMPDTFNSVKSEIGLTNSNIFDPETNIKAGYYYFCKNEKTYGTDKALVAYNQGYSNLDSALRLSRGRTTSYLSRVQNTMELFSKALK